MYLPVDLLACSRRRHSSPTRGGHQPVMTGHKCTTTMDRSRKREVMAALWSFLLDRLDVERSILRFPSPLHASEVALRILAKGNRKIESFLWGGRFGRSLLCPGRAEKKTRGSWPTTGCLPVDRNKLGPDSWRDEKGVWYRRDTHTHGIKAPWTARAPGASAHVTSSKNNSNNKVTPRDTKFKSGKTTHTLKKTTSTHRTMWVLISLMHRNCEMTPPGLMQCSTGGNAIWTRHRVCPLHPPLRKCTTSASLLTS